MALPLYIVNAFTAAPFGGNPAAVVPLAAWLPDHCLQAMAAQHQLSETAFFVGTDSGWQLRWFTPTQEVDLCGHATLATAHVLSTELGVDGVLSFATRSGTLRVEALGDARYTLDFPAVKLAPADPDHRVAEALGCRVLEAAKPLDNPWQWVYRVADQSVVAGLRPDFSALAAAADYGIAVTAPGDRHDFVSRFFIPSAGVDEDPVTGSAHCLLTPFWAERLNKMQLLARQISDRGGELRCALDGDRVKLTGSAVSYARGEILPEL